MAHTTFYRVQMLDRRGDELAGLDPQAGFRLMREVGRP